MPEKYWTLHIKADGTPELKGYAYWEIREKELAKLNDLLDSEKEQLFVLEMDKNSGSMVIDTVWPRAYVCGAKGCMRTVGRGESLCLEHRTQCEEGAALHLKDYDPTS